MLSARFHSRIADIGRERWQALCIDDNPFLSFDFLHGLEAFGCLQRRFGWLPHHLELREGERSVAVAPAYLKGNSHGEFVFDQRWAQAWENAGREYYPKLLCAVPYSPVPGARFLCGGGAPLRRHCLQALVEECHRLQLSSAHITFEQPGGDVQSPWLERNDWQFHWYNREYADFEAFLDALKPKKRKNIRQERAHLQEFGVQFERVAAHAASAIDRAAMYAFYVATFQQKGNLPVLTEEFFEHAATAFAERNWLVLAKRQGKAIAGAWFLESSDCLYGRYWGCMEPLPGLHFEVCYYQGIEHCIARGLRRFEPGAQGEHKIARGFLPVPTRSLHFLRDEAFRRAVRENLVHEAAWTERYGEELLGHSPYREVCGI